MSHEHKYMISTLWQGNKGEGTKNVRAYDRSHTVSIAGKPDLHLTTDNPVVGEIEIKSGRLIGFCNFIMPYAFVFICMRT